MKTILPLVLLFAAQSVHADFYYQYVGNIFDSISDVNEIPGRYTAGQRISGFFSTATELPENAGYGFQAHLINDWAFSDGRQIFTPGNTVELTPVFSTGADGLPNEWIFELRNYDSFVVPEAEVGDILRSITFETFGNGDQSVTQQCTQATAGGCLHDGVIEQAQTFDANIDGWTVSSIRPDDPPVVVPLPATLPLLIGAIFGLSYWRRTDH